MSTHQENESKRRDDQESGREEEHQEGEAQVHLGPLPVPVHPDGRLGRVVSRREHVLRRFVVQVGVGVELEEERGEVDDQEGDRRPARHVQDLASLRRNLGGVSDE